MAVVSVVPTRSFCVIEARSEFAPGELGSFRNATELARKTEAQKDRQSLNDPPTTLADH